LRYRAAPATATCPRHVIGRATKRSFRRWHIV
jgi:hypothetical protein